MLVTIRKAPPRYVQPGKAPDNAEWRALHRIADSHIASVRQTFLAAVQAAKDALPVGRVEFAATVAAQVVQAWEEAGRPVLTTGLTPELQAILEAAVAASQPAVLAVATGTVAQLQAGFNLVNATAARLAATQAGLDIQQITDSTLTATRQVLMRAFVEGRTVDDTAKDLRRFIGLTDRQTRQVQRYVQGLRGAQAVPGRMDMLIERRVQRLLAQRAEVVARHETMSASLAGQHSIWETTQQSGYLPDGMRRFAILAYDDRLCSRCRPIPGLNREGRRLDELFVTPNGPMLHPPFHVQCRCSVSMREVA